MGKIVMPKNSALLNEIESVLKIYYEEGDWLSNDTYKRKLMAIIGDDQYSSSYTKKAQITSYFGFTIWEDINNTHSMRRITTNGIKFYRSLLEKDYDAIREELLVSLETVSFGRNNYGCPDSNSDIEPPCVFVRASMDLGYLTYKEFAYILWKLEDCGGNYTDTIEEIKQLRSSYSFSLDKEAMKYTDCKPIMVLVRWGFLYEKDDATGAKQIIVHPDVLKKFEARLKNLKVYNIDKAPFLDVAITTDSISRYRGMPLSVEDRIIAKYNEIKDSLPDFEKYYKEFCDKFSPEMLQCVEGEELLKYIFLSGDNKDNMCWWLEFNQPIHEYFGSIKSGTACKYGLFFSKEKGAWVTGSSQKPIILSIEEAIALGTDMRDKIVAAAKYISQLGKISSVEEYIVIDKKVNEIIGDANKVWLQKYFHMIFPHLFATFTNDAWQNHVLFSCGLTPKEGRYVRSGQISLFATGLGISNAAFAQVVYQLFGGIKHFYRLGTSDASANYFSEWQAEKYAAVGWTGLGDLSTLTDKGELKKDAILEKMTEDYYPEDGRTASKKAGEICTFFNTNTEDSYFVAMDGKTLLALGKVSGEYYFDASKPLGHCKSVEWLHCFKNEELPTTEGLRTACFEIDDNENMLFLYNALNENNAVFNDEVESEIEEEITKMIERKPRVHKTHDLNCIIYGAPGTGKTYSTAEYAIDVCENKKTEFRQLSKEERIELMKKYEQLVSDGRVVFTTFHQSFGYEDFIQGLRPDTKSDGMKFKTVDGVFKKIADKAMMDTENDYVMIIDEINRGNISKIFGELITLIEDDKRWGEANQLSAILPSGQRFAVPNNLYIVGTMNSADKSISLIDTALRRRFAFVEKAPDASIITNPKIKAVLIKLNTYIKSELRSTDLLIGHAFFIGKEESDLGEVMNNHIIPLLYEYFFDDENKVKKALDCLDGTQYEIDKDYPGRIRIKAKVE
ncbi:MAG: AAA family ATPase [Clostridia bacterium]|nr:AAA family ATPase [Clostridia bacterium]